METRSDPVAVVTGGASGIGRALGLALARAVRTDVSRRADVLALADRAIAELGTVHGLCKRESR